MTTHQTGVLPHAHADLLTDAAYDYYGLRLATCGLDQKVKIWKQEEATGTWNSVDEWKAHDAPIVKLSWAHPEYGSVIASCSFDRTVKIWEERKQESKSASQSPWALRATLTDARSSVRSVEFAPPFAGLKLAAISTDMHLRIYECLEAHNLANWQVIEDLDMSSAPSPLLTSQGTPTLTAVPLEPVGSPSLTAPQAGGGSGAGPATPTGIATNTTAAAPTRPGIGAREADGGWCLSWCKEKWWGEVIAVGCGTSGALKIIEIRPSLRPITHLTLSHEPATKSSRASANQQQKTHAITSVSWAPSCGRSYHLVATGSRDCLVRIWKLKPPKQAGAAGEDGQWTAIGNPMEFPDHQASVSRVEWNVTGTVLSSAGDDGKVRLFKQAYGTVWRPVGEFSTEQVDDGDEAMADDR
ncbi:hypothetical protein FRB99_003227 [Tulasnella sp. 403]|nr:hypothetical protein FRB99_003227 [Tulasnella sp. 403]